MVPSVVTGSLSPPLYPGLQAAHLTLNSAFLLIIFISNKPRPQLGMINPVLLIFVEPISFLKSVSLVKFKHSIVLLSFIPVSTYLSPEPKVYWPKSDISIELFAIL